MQASKFCVKGKLGFHVENPRVLAGCCDSRNGKNVLNNLWIRKQGAPFSGLRLSMGAQLGGKRSVDSVFRNFDKARTSKVHATG